MINKFKYEKGDIILVKGNSIISKMISSFTKSEITHVACATGLDDMIIESDIGGVQYQLLNDKYQNIDYLVYRYNGNNKIPDKAVDFMESKLNKGYDYLGLFGIAAYLLHIKKKNNWDNKNKYWCSELVADGYLFAGADLPVNKDTWKVSPGDFLKFEDFKKVYEHKVK